MSAGHSAPTLPTATRAAASQVGIRARERAIPAESPSHAEAQWHEDSPYSLTVAGAAWELRDTRVLTSRLIGLHGNPTPDAGHGASAPGHCQEQKNRLTRPTP